MRHVAIVTEGRSSYGYFRPIARLIEARDDMRYSLVVTNQHLLPDVRLLGRRDRGGRI